MTVTTLIVLTMFATLIALAVYNLGGLEGVAPNRNYKSGSTWALWRWTRVDSEYILRLHVVKTPWFAVCLHWIRKPDAEPWLHDHPVSFLSVILRGKYAELRQRADEYASRLAVHRWFNFIRASEGDTHRIIFTRKNTLTLCFMGPKTREWGFHTPAGWVMWKEYYKLLRDGRPVRDVEYWQEKLLTSAKFEEILRAVYTPERIGQLAGAPPGTLVDFPLREIDTAPADDFKAEPPTEPGTRA